VVHQIKQPVGNRYFGEGGQCESCVGQECRASSEGQKRTQSDRIAAISAERGGASRGWWRIELHPDPEMKKKRNKKLQGDVLGPIGAARPLSLRSHLANHHPAFRSEVNLTVWHNQA